MRKDTKIMSGAGFRYYLGRYSTTRGKEQIPIPKNLPWKANTKASPADTELAVGDRKTS